MNTNDQMPVARAFTFSQSSLQDYLDCPRRFQLRYIQDLQWPAVEAEPLPQVETRQREALLFHRLVHQHFLGMPPASLSATASSPDLARWWRNFTTAAPDLLGWNIYAEKALVCQVGVHRLASKFDLLAVREGKAIIYDWKTFARRPTNEWLAARMQTKVYRSVLVQAGAELNRGRPFAPSDISMIYWFAEYPSDPAEFIYDERQHQEDWIALEALVREVSDAIHFPLTSDPLKCGFCAYRSLCDRGQRAGTGPDLELEPADTGPSSNDLEQVGQAQM